MKKFLLYLLPLLAISFHSCDNETLLPNASGAPYEVLVVMDDNLWKGDAGRALFDVLSANTPGVAQAENMFRISRISPVHLDNMTKVARNIIIVEISEKYSKSKIAYKKNAWAKPQAVVIINAPDVESFINVMIEYNEAITEFLVNYERERQIAFNRKNHNREATEKVKEIFGVQLYIPSNLKKFTTANHFFWASNMSLEKRQDIIVYSYPYTDPNTFTKEFLLQKRDSVLRANLPGPKEGSYMATERTRFEPSFKTIWKNGRYCAEIRGWWRVEGDMMGGPFISHTQLDEINNRVITVEGFVYAPGHAKRNLIRQLEAVVYSAKLPQDLIND